MKGDRDGVCSMRHLVLVHRSRSRPFGQRHLTGNVILLRGLTWSNAGPRGRGRLKHMKAILFAMSRMLRCVLAATLLSGVMSASSMAGGDRRNPDVDVVSPATVAHDCCDPGSTPDQTCRIVCAQSPCGLARLPAVLGAGASIACPSSWLPSAIVFPDSHSPETGTPPPRT